MSVSLYGYHITEDGTEVNSYPNSRWDSGSRDYVIALDINFSNQNFYEVFTYDLGFEVKGGTFFKSDLETLRDRALRTFLKLPFEENSYLKRKLFEILAFCDAAREHGATHVYAV